MDSPSDALSPRPGGFRIGPLEIASRALMAPMMGYNEPAIRRIARRYHSGYTVTEMIKPEQLGRIDRQLERELTIGPGERPVGAQISCRETEPEIGRAHV